MLPQFEDSPQLAVGSFNLAHKIQVLNYVFTPSSENHCDIALVSKKNKGIHLASWKKGDLCTLIEIQKSSAKYKNRPRQSKWLQVAKTLTKTN